MNQQIKKLFDQALAEFTAENKYATVVVPDPIQRDFVEKFAELIVRECSQFVEDKFDFCGDEIIIAEKIREHFGVEE